MTTEQLERARAGMAKAREALARKREQQKAGNMNTTTSVFKHETPTQPVEQQLVPATTSTTVDTGDQVFVLLKAGPGTPGIAQGKTYEEMWADATAKTGIAKADLLKQGHMFDVVSPEEAQKILA